MHPQVGQPAQIKRGEAVAQLHLSKHQHLHVFLLQKAIGVRQSQHFVWSWTTEKIRAAGEPASRLVVLMVSVFNPHFRLDKVNLQTVNHQFPVTAVPPFKLAEKVLSAVMRRVALAWQSAQKLARNETLSPTGHESDPFLQSHLAPQPIQLEFLALWKVSRATTQLVGEVMMVLEVLELKRTVCWRENEQRSEKRMIPFIYWLLINDYIEQSS